MWLWRQNQAKARLVVRIACVILVAHVCLMGLLFLAYGQSSVRSFTVSTQKPLRGQHIIVLPLHKKIPHSASPTAMPGLRQKMAGRSAGKRSASVSKRVSSVPKAAIVPKKTALVAPLPTKAKIVILPAKESPKKIDQLKPTIKKVVAKKTKIVAKKKEPVKKQQTPKVDMLQQKTPTVDKKPEPEIKKQIQEIQEKPVQPTSCQQEAEKPEQPVTQVADELSGVSPLNAQALEAEDAVYMHQDEYDRFVMYEQIQAEVARCWCPPPGVVPGTSCTLTFYVDWQGKAGTCTTIKPSTVLMFDMSARASLKDMVFPRSSYGKEITLTYM